MWRWCAPLRVAAITYNPIAETDLTRLSEDEAYRSWEQLAPAQKSSLYKVVFEMRGRDVIYVKEGPAIISRGRIMGRKRARAYRFDRSGRIIDFHGVPWNHQVPVEWATEFYPVRIQVGKNQRFTVEQLTDADVERIELAQRTARRAAQKTLSEEKYYRQSPAQRKLIIRRHNKLSNAFCGWLRDKYHVQPISENNQIDIRFELKSRAVLAELEVSHACGTRKSIREALGQLIEYNHYPPRNAADDWLLVLDRRPSRDDLHYIEVLRGQYSLPLFIGWQSRQGFDFPLWPRTASSD